MSRVFFPQPNSRFNFDSAKEYGEVRFVFTGRVPSLFETDVLLRELRASLKQEQFDAENDFIGLSGSVILVAFLLAAITAEYENVRILLFDAPSSRYVEREFAA